MRREPEAFRSRGNAVLILAPFGGADSQRLEQCGFSEAVKVNARAAFNQPAKQSGRRAIIDEALPRCAQIAVLWLVIKFASAVRD